MKTIEELLREIKIRFGENWQEQKLLFNAVDRENEHYNSEALGAQTDRYMTSASITDAVRYENGRSRFKNF